MPVRKTYPPTAADLFLPVLLLVSENPSGFRPNTLRYALRKTEAANKEFVYHSQHRSYHKARQHAPLSGAPHLVLEFALRTRGGVGAASRGEAGEWLSAEGGDLH